MSELLPCPFCGSRPKESERADNYTSTGHVHFISCMCGGYSANAHQYGETHEEVVSKWNRRAAPHQSADVPGWQPIETAPQDGYMLVHEDGAIRALYRYNGAWQQVAHPAIIADMFGDLIVGEDTKRILPPGYKLGLLDGCCENPTHWMPLPEVPADQQGEK